MRQRHKRSRPFGRFTFIGGPRERGLGGPEGSRRLRLCQLSRQCLERPRQRLELGRKCRPADLLQHGVKRLVRLRLGQLNRQRLKRLR
jgi:hypothetical protein